MLNLADYKKSRAYKETWEEASEATLADVAKKMAKQGLSAEDIAKTLEMELATVKKFLKSKSKK